MARGRDGYRNMSGQEKAAVFMLSLETEHSTQIFELMDDQEIKEISMAMSNLGAIDSDVVEKLFIEFADQLSSTGSLIGSYDSTERYCCRRWIVTKSISSWRSCAGLPAAPCGTSWGM